MNAEQRHLAQRATVIERLVEHKFANAIRTEPEGPAFAGVMRRVTSSEHTKEYLVFSQVADFGVIWTTPDYGKMASDAGVSLIMGTQHVIPEETPFDEIPGLLVGEGSGLLFGMTRIKPLAQRGEGDVFLPPALVDSVVDAFPPSRVEDRRVARELLEQFPIS